MDDLRTLYQEVILDHSKRPRNFHKMEDATQEAEGYNPLCGDKLKLFLKTKDGIIEDISFEGSGCAISTASASMLTEYLKGKDLKVVEPFFKKFQTLVMGGEEDPQASDINLGKLAIFEGVKEFPMRVKCATLSWHTLKAALENKGDIAKTE